MPERRVVRYPSASEWGGAMSWLKRQLSRPVFKYSVLGGGAGLWLVGLVDQLSTSAGAMKYMAVSLLMAVVAFL
jgi:hypothetical protein